MESGEEEKSEEMSCERENTMRNFPSRTCACVGTRGRKIHSVRERERMKFLRKEEVDREREREKEKEKVRRGGYERVA